MTQRSTALLAAAWLALAGQAAGDDYERQPGVDVVHYQIELELRDDGAFVSGTTSVHVRLRRDGVASLWLDFQEMRVDGVRVGGAARPFVHQGGRLSIKLPRAFAAGEILVVEVRYHGSAGTAGLVAGRNVYGRPVVFADNWPEGARHWFPAVDHPSDKATVEFRITAPERYEVIAPGRLMEERSLLDGRKLVRWSQGVPVPTYCMVIGAAEFSVAHAGYALGVPIVFDAYPQDAEPAAQRFRRTAQVMQFMSDTVGPYPYEKLAQVQSTTRYGGTEYASAIFYAEKVPRGEEADGLLVPHEIAHQWWGDSVTPADWDDLWLSEGFATYFAALFAEQLGGAAALRREMERAQDAVKQLHAKSPGPIIAPALSPTQKLNAYTYQKGAWLLHMLRRRLGDATFFGGLRRFYALHAGANASSEDLRRVLEAESGTNLETFFRQWLHEPGFPEYEVAWRWDRAAGEVVLDLAQSQASGPFDMPVELAFHVGDTIERRTLRVSERSQTLRVALPSAPTTLELDPDGWLLKSVRVSGPGRASKSARPGGPS